MSKRVTFILADTHCTYVSVVHENEHRPYRRRAITIELTPEQSALLETRVVGVHDGKDVREEILDCFLENEAGVGDVARGQARKKGRGVMGGRAMRQVVHDRAGGQCEYCGIEKTLLTIDHVVPKIKGGRNELSNYKGACSECNSLKGNLSEAEFRANVLPVILYRQRRRFPQERQEQIIAEYTAAIKRRKAGA